MTPTKKHKERTVNEILSRSEGKILLLVFTADWISQSTIVTIVLEKIALAVPELLIEVIDAEVNEALLSRLSVSELPTAFFIRDGQLNQKITGTFSKKDILNVI